MHVCIIFMHASSIDIQNIANRDTVTIDEKFTPLQTKWELTSQFSLSKILILILSNRKNELAIHSIILKNYFLIKQNRKDKQDAKGTDTSFNNVITG